MTVTERPGVLSVISATIVGSSRNPATTVVGSRKTAMGTMKIARAIHCQIDRLFWSAPVAL